MIKTKRAKATLAVTLAILLALTVGTVAFFVDRATHHMEFTTATFTDNGYSLDRTAPVGPFAAGESIDVDIKETNTGAEDIESSIKMTATWSSPDTQLSIFGNAKAEDNAVLTIAGEPLNYEVSADSKSISFTLPDQFLGTESNNKAITRELLLTIPESFVSTGTVTFTFDKVTVSQSPIGFTVDYDNIDLDTLQCSTQVVWAAGKVTSQPNSHKAIYGYLNNDCKGITFQMGFNFNSSVMKDFANTTDAKWTHYSDRVDNITLVEGMSTIGDYAFPNFELVTEIEIPQSVTAIGTYAFDNTGLEDLIIPASVTKFEAMSFGHCNSLVEITFIGAIGTNIEFPTAGADTGAFYVTPYVEPTNRTKINTTNKDALEYDWVTDHRKLVPIMQSWTHDAATDFHALKDEITAVYFTDSYALPSGFDTSAGNGPWDVSAAQDKSVMAYMVSGLSTDKIYYEAEGVDKASLTGTGTMLEDEPTWNGSEFTWTSSLAEGVEASVWNGSYPNWVNYFVPDDDPTVYYSYSAYDGMTKHYYDYYTENTVVISSNTGWTEDVIANEHSRYICYDFANLRSFNGTHLDTSTAEDMRQMFSDCGNLTKLTLNSWDTSNVSNYYGMFNNCSSLTSIDLNLDTSSIDDASLTDTDLASAITYDERTNGICGGLGHLFDGCSSLTTLDVSDWDTSKAQSLCYTFNDCNNLETLDVSDFDVSNVKTFDHTFQGLYVVDALDVSDWNTGSAETMYSMFEDCCAVTSLAVRNWDVSKVKDFTCAFENCFSMKTLDVSQWDTSSAEDMTSMFWICESLEELDVSGWDVSNVESFYFTFGSCLKLTEIPVGNWDTSGAKTFYYMFNDCESLVSIDVATKVVNEGEENEYIAWDTSHVYSFQQMFAYCYSLEEIDVSDWVVTESGTQPNGEEKPYFDTALMFAGSKISEITLGAGWDCLDNTLYGMGYLKDITFEHTAKDTLTIPSETGKWYGLAYVGYDGSYITSSPYNANNLLPTTIHVSGQEISDIVSAYAWEEDFRDVTVLGTFTGIEITTPPTKTTYYEGDNFEKAGMVVKAVYNNGVKVEIDDYTVTNGDSLSNGQTSVTISYTEEYSGTTKTATQNITVKPNVQRIDVTTQPTKTTYTEGETFDKAGMVVTATFNDGSTRDVTAECVIEDGYKLTEGKTTVTVSYTLNGVTVKATVNITVEPAMITVTYDAHGGTFANGETTNTVVYDPKTYNVVSGVYEEPTDDIYGFYDWYTDSACTDGKEFNLIYAESDVTVYAKWVAVPTLAAGQTWYKGSSSVQQSITTINIVDSYTPKGTEIASWNADVDDSGSIKCYVDGTTLIIAGNGSRRIFANPDSTRAFGGWNKFSGVTTINGFNMFDTSRVTNMQEMFRDSISLKDIDLSSWNTSKVTNMSSMFRWCTGLTSFSIPNSWDTSNVTTMCYMFGECENLTTLNLSALDTSGITDYRYFSAFAPYCQKLTTIVLGEKFGQSVNAGNVIPGAYSGPGIYYSKGGLFFTGTSTREDNAVSLPTTVINANSVMKSYDWATDMRPVTFVTADAIYITYNANGGNFSAGQIANTVGYDKSSYDVLSGTYKEPTLTGTEFVGWYTDAACTPGNEFNIAEATEDTTVYAKWNTFTVTYNSTYGEFESQSLGANGATTFIQTNAVAFDKSSRQAVFGSYADPTLDLGEFVGWYTDSACTAGNEFNIDEVTEDITVYAKWNIQKAVLASDTGWFAGKLTDNEQAAITSINVVNSYTPTGNETKTWIADITASGRIKCYLQGTTLTIAGNGSETIYFNPQWDDRTNSFSYFAAYFPSLTTVDFSDLDVSLVTNMSYMFYGCNNLTTVDLSGWDTSNVTDMSWMFCGCNNLKTIYVSNLWSTDSVTNSIVMFSGCTSLVGGNGTPYNSSYVDATYARIDGGPSSSTPGYLTYKAASAAASVMSFSANDNSLDSVNIQ